jgi:AcrR family transcriptional regulator
MTSAIALAILAAVFIGIGDFVGGVLGRRDPTPAARIDDISVAAGLAKSTIYNYFKSKEAAFCAVLADFGEQPTNSISDSSANSSWTAAQRTRAWRERSVSRRPQFALASVASSPSTS